MCLTQSHNNLNWASGHTTTLEACNSYATALKVMAAPHVLRSQQLTPVDVALPPLQVLPALALQVPGLILGIPCTTLQVIPGQQRGEQTTANAINVVTET